MCGGTELWLVCHDEGVGCGVYHGWGERRGFIACVALVGWVVTLGLVSCVWFVLGQSGHGTILVEVVLGMHGVGEIPFSSFA